LWNEEMKTLNTTPGEYIVPRKKKERKRLGDKSQVLAGKEKGQGTGRPDPPMVEGKYRGAKMGKESRSCQAKRTTL